MLKILHQKITRVDNDLRYFRFSARKFKRLMKKRIKTKEYSELFKEDL
jgi:hypothetical protein